MSNVESELGWDTIASWSKNVPFGPGETKRPKVIDRRSAVLSSWGPDPDGRHRTPCWVHTSTETIGFVCTMSVAPGDFFEIGNHPNLETYFQLAGVLHVSNPDTGQVCEIRPGEAFLMPAYQYHIGYNFGTEESVTIACVPGESHTAEFHDNPSLAENYDRRQVALFGGVSENEGFPSHLAKLREWPVLEKPLPGNRDDFVVIPRSDWLHVVFGDDPRAALLGSFYYSSPQLAAYVVTVPTNRIGVAQRLGGETVVYVQKHNVIIDILNSGDALYAEEGDAVYIPPGVPFQYQNRIDEPIELLVFTAPWEGASLVSG